MFYFTPYELKYSNSELEGQMLKVTPEQLDSDENDDKGRVELLNLFYVKHLAYTLLGFSCLNLEGHSMKSKFIIATSDAEFKPSNDTEAMVQEFFS